jgi:hypothetical protein
MKAVAVVATFTVALVISPIYAQDQHPPFPASMMAAKTVYIDNETGDAKITDRANDAIRKWGRFQISKNAKDAELILRFTADTKGKPTPPNKDIDISPTPIHFSVLDGEHRELWFASKNKPFHRQTQLDLDEFKNQIEGQEKSHGG